MSAVEFVKDLRNASSGRQLLVGGVVVVVLIFVFAAIYFAFLRKPYGVLFSNLRTTDAATIVADLDKKKIPYQLRDGGTTILAPQSLIDSTRLSIASEDLPLKGTVGFELFNKSDMGLTEFAQRINYQRALQGELARTIMSMDTVDSARVHLSLAEPSVFRDDQRPPKASVELIPRPGREISPDTVRGVQRLIAAAVPDLNVADVVVLDSHGGVVSSESGAGASPVQAEAPALGSPRAQQWRAIEDYYAASIRRALEKVYPNNDELVTVTAQIGSAPSGDNGEALDKWTPGSRNFGLKVVVAPTVAPAPEQQIQVQSLVTQAAGLRSELGDAVTIGAAQTTLEIPPAAARVALSAAPAMAAASPVRNAGLSPSAFWAAAIALWIAAMGGTAFWLLRRFNRRGGLSDSQRKAYVQRLNALLDREEADAAASL